MTLILRCDVAGMPVEWLAPEGAARLYALDRVAWGLGEVAMTFHGGTCLRTGRQSTIEVQPIVSVTGTVCESGFRSLVPPLANAELFRRDGQLCLYCGERFPPSQLTRDHVVPVSRGGPDGWENVVSACKRCNQAKAARTPEEADMPLLAVPYAPNRAEWLILSNRRIVADQMAFLRQRVGRNSRLLK